jgi:hypothetical protein
MLDRSPPGRRPHLACGDGKQPGRRRDACVANRPLGCEFYASLGQPARQHWDTRETLAVACAAAAAADHTTISDAQIQVLSTVHDPQVVEPHVLTSFDHTGQMFGCLIGDEPATDEDKDAGAAWIARLPDAPSGASLCTKRHHLEHVAGVVVHGFCFQPAGSGSGSQGRRGDARDWR